MQATVRHTDWCDGFHLQVGTPECSRLALTDEGREIMFFGTADTGEVAVVETTELVGA